jgi:IS30 family transposase
MKKYHRIEIKERTKIYELKLKGYGVSEIANILRRNKSSISRELRRNLGFGCYHPLEADEEAKTRRKIRSGKIEGNKALESQITVDLKKHYSPEQIAGSLRVKGVRICHETIYQYIYRRKPDKEDLYKYLRYRHHVRFARGTRKPRLGKIKDAVSIHARPKSVEKRKSYGHFEADLMMTHKGRSDNFLVLVERKSRATFIMHNTSKHADNIANKLNDFCKKYKVKSITFDNGKEFAGHYSLGVKTYFCDTYSPWQKGTVENTISRIRHLYNKFNGDQRMIQNHLNNTPRKVLGFHKPQNLIPNLLINRCTTI